jgi:hypothetical protein
LPNRADIAIGNAVYLLAMKLKSPPGARAAAPRLKHTRKTGKSIAPSVVESLPEIKPMPTHPSIEM